MADNVSRYITDWRPATVIGTTEYVVLNTGEKMSGPHLYAWKADNTANTWAYTYVQKPTTDDVALMPNIGGGNFLDEDPIASVAGDVITAFSETWTRDTSKDL